MTISDRLRALLQEKELSRGQLEDRTGLLRNYISRVENGHTTPAIGTLEKLAWALEIPLYRLFMMARALPSSRFLGGRPKPTLFGALREEMRAFYKSCDVGLVAWMNVAGNC